MLIEIINRAEDAYRNLWHVIVDLKNGSIKAKDIVEFQPRLARVIRSLDNYKESISNSKRELVSKKHLYNEKWFASRMRILNNYQESLGDAAKIGRALGDGFVWYFLRKSRELFNYHKEHCPTNNIPKGLGGEGEIRLLECSPLLGEYFILYHGITNFLRVGDVSLVSLRDSELYAIGEIKTSHKENNNISINTFIVANANRPLNAPVKISNKEDNPISQMPIKFQERLKKQRHRMGIAITRNAPDVTAEMPTNTYFPELNSLLISLKESDIAYQKCGKAMLLMGVRLNNHKLSSRLLQTKLDSSKWLDNIPKSAFQIANANDFPDALDALSIKINHIIPCVVMGLTPILWWPIDISSIKEIYFQEIVIFTVFNPAYLIQKLRQNGFQITVKENARKISISKKQDGYKFWQDDMQWYFGLIEQQLLKEDSIVSMYDTLMERICSEDPKKSLKINMNIMHDI